MPHPQNPYYDDSQHTANSRIPDANFSQFPRIMGDSGFANGIAPGNPSFPVNHTLNHQNGLTGNHQGAQENFSFLPPLLPNMGNNQEMQYGHFAITTARYPEPWHNAGFVNYSQFLPVQSAPRMSYDYAPYPVQVQQQPHPTGFSIHDALMNPPPSPNILSYYMYDHPMNLKRNFHPAFHVPNVWNSALGNNQNTILPNQYGISNLQHPSAIGSNLSQYRLANPTSYAMLNYRPWGTQWNGNTGASGFTHGNFNQAQFNSGFPPNYAPDPLNAGINHSVFDPRQVELQGSAPVDLNVGLNLGSIPYPSLSLGMSMAPSIPLALVPGTNISIKDAGSYSVRDHLLQYAHSIYTSTPHAPTLLPMLSTLDQLHPNHLPILLLVACVYYAQGDYQQSLNFHSRILELDPNYVEAMSNIGTTLRSMGNDSEAEIWWRKAIDRKPAYWDAVENLLGLLTTSKAADSSRNQVASSPRHEEAYHLCCTVEDHILGGLSFNDFTKSATHRLPTVQMPRFLGLLYIKGNMCFALNRAEDARIEYEKALQLMFGGMSIMEVIQRILVLHTHSPNPVPRLDELLRFEVSQYAPILVDPDICMQVAGRVFPDSGGVLPGLASLPRPTDNRQQSPFTTANNTVSAIILTLAKLYQDASPSAQPLSMLLPLYYLSMSLCPSPSTCNNLGILLCNIPAPPPTPAQLHPPSGSALALQYYTRGLQIDNRHPHLYTNLGSLLKDMGNINEAIRMYEKAVECNPKFDVALANLGNALKDSGRTQDSIQWYMRAVEINPDFIEAVCGLVSALGGICDWRGRTAYTDPITNVSRIGWIDRITNIVDTQLASGMEWGRGTIFSSNSSFRAIFISDMSRAFRNSDPDARWQIRATHWDSLTEAKVSNEGGWVVRAIERAMRHLQRQWYLSYYQVNHYLSRIDLASLSSQDIELYRRPTMPPLPAPALPTVLPFHTFTYPLGPRQIRLISHRNALRISHSVLLSQWLPPTVYPPPPPPFQRLRLGYVSSDFNNHPLAHLMQSVFGLHCQNRFEVFLYATTPPDNSPYRSKIQSSTPHFLDVSGWSTQAIVEQIVQDGIHILINLNGYTKGARNEVFAARPSPILMSYMGFAGTLGSSWCDWFIADPVVCPPSMVATDQFLLRENTRDSSHQLSQVDSLDIDPEEQADNWVYTERLIYLPHSYFVNDHRQGFRDPEDANYNENRTPLHPLQRPRELLELEWLNEESRRWRMRRELFPHLNDDTVIFANFNQLYKIDPAIFKVWLDILTRVPNSVLWLLRFPAAGEIHLKNTAKEMAGDEVASRVIFTDVAPKHIHIHRGRIADIFFDTPECNAHTTAADILWSGTPIITYARHVFKMCSRVAASIAYATGYGSYMVTDSEKEYADQAVKLASSLSYRYINATDRDVILERLGLSSSVHLLDNQAYSKDHRLGQGDLIELRKALFLTRDHSRLFDTSRWVRNLEKGYLEAWKRWESKTDDSAFSLTYKHQSSDSPVCPAYLKPQYRSHVEQYLNDNLEEGISSVKSACIWIQDDADDYMLAQTMAAATYPVGSNQLQSIEDHTREALVLDAPNKIRELPTGGCAMPSA